MATSRKVERRLQRKEKRYETEQLMKTKRSEDYDSLEEVFDRPTLMTVYEFLNRGIIEHIYGVFKSGKESRLYLGTDPKEKDIAIKIYLTTSAEFKKGMLTYINGDTRFKHVKKGQRSLVYAWAQKEFKNLQKAYESGVRVPEPYYVKNNVLVMEFIGEDGVPSPLLREKKPLHPKKMYNILLNYVKILYQRAKLVHGDLSEYNVMNYREEPVIFDFGQAVTLEHPNADQMLHRDLNNLNIFFSKLDVGVKSIEEVYRWIREDE